MAETIAQLGEEFDSNYDLFIGDAIATGCIWGLEGEDGWALCPSVTNEDLDVMPLWSQPEYAEAQCVEAWSEYKPVAIALDEFLDEWLPGMHDDVLMVGVNFNDDMEGHEIEPLDLAEDIEEVL